jgi:signal transduction histidine kinase
VFSRVAIVPTCMALMFGGLVLDILTPQQFIAAIFWIVPIALSGLVFSKRFTYSLVIAAIVLNVLVSWLNAGAQGGLDGISVLNRLLLAATAVMVGVMTVNLSAFSGRVGQLQERESKLRQERDLERITAVMAGSQTFKDAIEHVVPVLNRVLEANGALIVGQAHGVLVAPRVAQNVEIGILPIGAPSPSNLEDLRVTHGDLNGKPALLVQIVQPSVLIAILEPSSNAAETFSRLLPVLTRALERVLLLEDLSRQRALLERRNTVIRDLVYAFSHDLRTPLMANGMNMKLALEGAFGALPERYLDSLRNGFAANQDVLELADELLLVARFESGESSPQTENIRLHRALEEMVARLLPIANAKNIEFKLDLEPLDMHGNSLDIRRVLQNLLDNAIKFSPAESSIEISLKLSKNESNQIARLEVRDAGPGVPAEVERRLFTRFSSPRAGGGSGLGLYLAKGIVEAHHGTIGYARDQKTTFWVELPAIPE